jgi:PIN domain nuclease of toxin-antitoxin system
MNVLLDTHALVWSLQDSPKLSARARRFLVNEAHEVLVSAASAWEIAMRVRSGKWPDAKVVEENFAELIQIAGFVTINVTVENALRAGRLHGAHGDPFDRMIAAQALALDIPVLSTDAKLDSFGVRRIW